MPSPKQLSSKPTQQSQEPKKPPFGHQTERDLKAKNQDLGAHKDNLELNKRAINQNSSIIMRDESCPFIAKKDTRAKRQAEETPRQTQVQKLSSQVTGDYESAAHRPEGKTPSFKH